MSDLFKPLYINKLNYLIVGTGRCGTVFLAKLLSSLGIPCGHETIFQCDGMEFNLARLQNSIDLPSLSVSMTAKNASVEDEKEGRIWFGKNRKLEADASYMAAPFLDDQCLENTKIIHVVRNPLKVINSFVNGFGYFKPESIDIEDVSNGWLYSQGEYHRFIYKYVPELYDDSLTSLDRAAIYYVKWNSMIRDKCDAVHRKKLFTPTAFADNYFLQRIEDGYDELIEFLGKDGENAYKNTSVNKIEGLKDIGFDSISNEVARTELVEMGKKYGYV